MSEQELKIRLERLRGSLGLEEIEEGRGRRGPGARGLERMARNQRCQRLAAVNLANANAAAAAHRLGIPDRSEDASTFAAGRGEKFETRIFDENCKRVWEMYDREQIPVGGARDVKDMEKDFEFEVRRQHSEQLLLACARGEQTETLVLKPRLTVHLAGQEFDIEPDALVLDPDGFYRVAEIKSYADRRGYTDGHKTGSAARQAAVAVVALRQLLETHQLDPQMVPATADLIFSNSGSDTPTLNRVQIAGEVENISTSFTAAAQTAEAVLHRAGDGTLDDPETIRRLAPHLCDDCATHCPMWEFCRREAIDQRHPAILGDGAVEVMGSMGSLDDVLAIVDGVRPPADEDQATVAGLLRSALEAWQVALTAEDPYEALAAGEDEDAGLDDSAAAPLYGSSDAEDEEQLEVIT